MYISLPSDTGLIVKLISRLADVRMVSCERLLAAMGGFLGLNIVYTYAASGEVTGQNLDTAWSCTNLWSGLGILFSPVFSGVAFLFTLLYTVLILGDFYLSHGLAEVMILCMAVCSRNNLYHRCIFMKFGVKKSEKKYHKPEN